MDQFPEFMKNPANRIARTNQATPGVEGYIFDGVDGSQMAFWTCNQLASSSAHAHDYDEYMIVVQGFYTLIDGQSIPLKAGEEYFIGKGVPHSGEVVAGTRTIHVSAAIEQTERDSTKSIGLVSVPLISKALKRRHGRPQERLRDYWPSPTRLPSN